MKPLKIVIAPDSYKGSLTSEQAGLAMAAGLRRVFPDAHLLTVPIADGGEGTVEAVCAGGRGELHHTEVCGPQGERVNALWGLCPTPQGPAAILEVAEACGLTLTPPDKRNVRTATSFGVGELIAVALKSGARRLIIGLGGSATNDAGAGMAQALGVRLTDAAGCELPRGGAALAKLASIDISAVEPELAKAEVLLASDVTNPLCGPEGATAVYGPQKGADAEAVAELDAALRNFSKVAAQDLKRDVSSVRGAGAAGGLGAGLMLFANAKVRPGIELIMELIGFEELIKDADLIFTGEGFTDSQTARGKTPAGIAALAKRYKIPVVCLSGGLSADAGSLYASGISALSGIARAPISLEECVKQAAGLVEEASERCARLIKVGLGIVSR